MATGDGARKGLVRRLGVCLVLVALIAGCAPAPVVPTVQPTAAANAIAPTAQPPATSTAAPSETPTARSTDTPTRAPTLTKSPTTAPPQRPAITPAPQLSLGPEGSGLLIYHDGGKTKSKYLDPTFSQAGIKLELPAAISPARGVKATLVFFFESNMEPTSVKVVEAPGLESASATVTGGKAAPGTGDSGAASDYREYELTLDVQTATASSGTSDYAIDLRLLYENGFIPVKVTGIYPLPTPTPTQTVRPTSTNTRVPRTATPTPDVSTLGAPAEPFPWDGWNPPGFLAYDVDAFHVYQRSIHGRPVTIAWAKDTNVPEAIRRQVSDFYFVTFIKWWDIFEGFPYSTYTVVLKNDSAFAGGEQGIGYEGIANNYTTNYHERVAHEVLHAWIGNALKDNQERKYDDGLWFREGVTQYYGDRGAGVTEYGNWMKDHWRTYQREILGTQYDVPLTDMPAKGKEVGEDPAGNNRQYRIKVYWKGALVAYLLDQQLAAQGLSLDDLLKYLYDNYTLQRRGFTTSDAIQALNTISGKDWTDFFNRYIYGTEPLPLNGSFRYLQH